MCLFAGVLLVWLFLIRCVCFFACDLLLRVVVGGLTCFCFECVCLLVSCLFGCLIFVVFVLCVLCCYKLLLVV